MSWFCHHRACISLGWRASADAGCAGNWRIVERAVWYEILTPGILSAWCVWWWCFGKFSWCVLIILLSIWYNVCACHSPVYHYITATAFYLIQRFITACVVVMWSQSLYLSRMNSQCGHYVCCKSTSTRWKKRFEIKYSWCRQTSSCLLGVLHCTHMWATAGHHYVYVDYYSKLPVTGCRPSDVQSMLGWQGWFCPRVPCIWTTLCLLLLLWYIFFI